MQDRRDAMDGLPDVRPELILAHGITAIFVGIGLARFAYSPIIPLLIRDGWYSAYEAQLLGAWGLAGYLLGGFVSQPLARRFPPGGLAGTMGFLVLLALVFCSFPIPFPHAAFWRTMSGVAGAVLMIASVSDVNARLVEAGRPGWTALVFFGVGGGAALGSIVMVFLPDVSAVAASTGLAALCALALVVNLHTGRRMRQPSRTGRGSAAAPRAAPALHRVVLLAIAAYVLDAFGMTAYTLYLVDYATREVGMAPRTGALIWTAFGVGAILSPLLLRRLGRGGLVWLCVAKGMAIASVAFSSSSVLYWGATFVVGVGAPGVAMLLAAFFQRTVGTRSYIRYWATATTSFAFAQMVGGFSGSRLSHLWGGYAPVFLLGAASLALAAVIVLAAEYLRARALDAGEARGPQRG